MAAREVLSVDDFLSGEKFSGILDSAAWADTGASGDGSRGFQMNRLGCKWTPCEKGSGSIVAGLSAIHARLQLRADGSPGLKIFRTCKNLIHELTGLVYDQRQIEAYDARCSSRAKSTRVRHSAGADTNEVTSCCVNHKAVADN
jgi:hypothetical protein